MNLYDIRKIVSDAELDKLDCRSEIRAYLNSMHNQFQVAMTITLHDVWFGKNGLMKVKHPLVAEDLPKICERLESKLNKLVWKNGFVRYDKSLNFFKVWEDGHGTKKPHLHYAVGNFPSDFKMNTLPGLVEKASGECFEIDLQHKEDICDSGWLEYITKEVGKKDTDKVLW
jgi:hypothetical protein